MFISNLVKIEREPITKLMMMKSAALPRVKDNQRIQFAFNVCLNNGLEKNEPGRFSFVLGCVNVASIIFYLQNYLRNIFLVCI